MDAENCKHQYIEACDIGLCCLSCGAVRNSIPETPSITPGTPHPFPDDEYQYSALDQDLDEIRLVEIYPGAKSDPIFCRILTAGLPCCPPYLAVSYTWATEDGDATTSQSVHVLVGKGSKDRRTLKVTKNCENALRQLRQADHYETVWIDSLSIDQNCISERNHQVSIMGRIYSRALSVEMCIQAPSQDYLGAINLLARPDSWTEHFRGLHDHEFGQHPHILQLARLFDLRYFSRVWVIQEVLHARVAHLHVDNHIVRFYGAAIIFLHEECSAKAINIYRLAQWASICQRETGIISLLSMSTKSSASDPRDTVFAITSLLYPNTRAMIKIDYLLSLEHVLAQAVMACIAECRDLAILSYAALPPDGPILTTPCFTMTHFKEFLEQMSSTGKPDQSLLPRRLLPRMRSPWLAETVSELERSRGCDDRECRHIACDRRSRTPPTEHSSSAGKQPAKGSGPPMQHLPRLNVPAHFVDLCTGPIEQDVIPLFAQVDAIYGSVDEAKWSWLFHLFPNIHTSTDFDEVMRDTQRLETFKRDMIEIAKETQTTDLVAFRTEYSIGLTSTSFLAGDAVFLIEGAQHPMLLREVSHGTYRIVGKCYLWAAADPYPEHSKCFLEAGRYGERHKRRGFIEIY